MDQNFNLLDTQKFLYFIICNVGYLTDFARTHIVTDSQDDTTNVIHLYTLIQMYLYPVEYYFITKTGDQQLFKIYLSEIILFLKMGTYVGYTLSTLRCIEAKSRASYIWFVCLY